MQLRFLFRIDIQMWNDNTDAIEHGTNEAAFQHITTAGVIEGVVQPFAANCNANEMMYQYPVAKQ